MKEFDIRLDKIIVQDIYVCVCVYIYIYIYIYIYVLYVGPVAQSV